MIKYISFTKMDIKYKLKLVPRNNIIYRNTETFQIKYSVLKYNKE